MIPRLDLPARRRTNDVRQARQSSWPEPRVKSGLTEFSKRPWFYILGVVFHYVNSWLSSKRLGFDPVVLCVRYSGGGQGPEIGHIDQRENTAARFGSLQSRDRREVLMRKKSAPWTSLTTNALRLAIC